MTVRSVRDDTTRDRLLDAAEVLYAERGVDAVTLREIGRAAGQLNTGAIQYHFGDRAALVGALFDRHLESIDAAQHQYLDRCGDHRHDVHCLVESLVWPIAEHLRTASGRRFVQIQAQHFQRLLPENVSLIDPTQRSAFDRWRLAVETILSPEGLATHIRFTVVQFAYSELANWSRRADQLDIEQAGAHVVRLTAALLAAATP